MEERIETYVMLLKHEMLAESIKVVDKKYVKGIVLRAGGKISEVEEVIDHPNVREVNNGEYIIVEELSH